MTAFVYRVLHGTLDKDYVMDGVRDVLGALVDARLEEPTKYELNFEELREQGFLPSPAAVRAFKSIKAEEIEGVKRVRRAAKKSRSRRGAAKKKSRRGKSRSKKSRSKKSRSKKSRSGKRRSRGSRK